VVGGSENRGGKTRSRSTRFDELRCKKKILQEKAKEALNSPTQRSSGVCLLAKSPHSEQSIGVGMKLDANRRIQGRSDRTVCDLEVNYG